MAKYKPPLNVDKEPKNGVFYPQNYKRPKVDMAAHNMQKAFKAIGGWRALADWGKNNPTEFYRLWARTLPKEVVLEADVNDPFGNGGNVRLLIDGVMSDTEKERYRELIGDDLPGEFEEVSRDEFR